MVLLRVRRGVTTTRRDPVEANQAQELNTTLLWLGLAYLGLFTVRTSCRPQAGALRGPVDHARRGGDERVLWASWMIHGSTWPGRTAPSSWGARCRAVRRRPDRLDRDALELFIGTLWFVRDHRTLAPLRLHDGLRRTGA